MTKFRIEMVRTAYVSSVEIVEADTVEEASRIAVDRALDGDVIWRYEGPASDDPDIDVVSSSEV